MSAGSGYGLNSNNGRSMQPSRLDHNHQQDPNHQGYSYARHQPFEPSLTSPPMNPRAGLNEFFSNPSPLQSPPHPGNFAQTINPYGVEPPFDPYPISSSAPPPLQPLPTSTKTVSPIAPNFTPVQPLPQTQSSLPQRSVSTSPTVQKKSLNPGAGTFAFKPSTAPPSESDFPALSASPSKPTSNNKVSAPPSTTSLPPSNSNSNLSRTNTPSNASVTSNAKSKGKGKSKSKESNDGTEEKEEEVDLTTLIDQLYQAAEKIKQVQSSQDAQVALALAKEDELIREREEKEKERKEREKDQKRFEVEMKRFEEEQKKMREKHEIESKKRAVVEVQEKKKMVTIHRGVQVELPQRLPTPPPPVRPLTPPPPPIASTSSSAIPSSSTGPQPSSEPPLDLSAISEYQRLLSNVQAKLSQVELDKVALDHRIAIMVQEKETLWPEQRAVLMQKAEGEKRELEKKLEKALKRVEVLEKDRPAPVLRIGSGPPKFITPKPKASEATSIPDPRLLQLESRIAEIEGDLTEATSRAITAEEALEEYQTRADKLLEEQQNQIDSLSLKAEKSQEALQLSERKIAGIKKKAQELVESHQATLRERKVGEDEARNEMLRLKDEVKRVQEELDKEVQKSTRDLAASERRKIESKHQGMREADKQKFDKELAQLKAQLERERKAHEYELDERGLSHGEELGDLEYQLRDETEQHAREIDSLNKKHELEINALKAQLQQATQSSNLKMNGSTPLSARPSSISTPIPSRAKPKVEVPIPRASMADQNESTKEVFSKLGQDWVTESLSSS